MASISWRSAIGAARALRLLPGPWANGRRKWSPALLSLPATIFIPRASRTSTTRNGRPATSRCSLRPVCSVRGMPCSATTTIIGSIEAQIAYTAKSPRWRMPARMFSWSELLPDGGLADFFFIDTTPVYDGTHGWRTTFVPLETFVVEQFRWLRRELAASKADWKIVVGHHPVFSGGAHGAELGADPLSEADARRAWRARLSQRARP